MLTSLFAYIMLPFAAIAIEMVGAVLGSGFNLPVQLPDQIANGFTLMTPIWNELQNIFPMDVLFQVLVLMLMTEVILYVIRFFLWLFKKIPGIS